ncbi:sugar phosphate isomerase/epimerase, partial [Streptomyces sp. DT17]
QPCAEMLGRLAGSGFDGHVVIEVNTRRAMSTAERESDLAEALAFTRLHLTSAPARRPRPRPG